MVALTSSITSDQSSDTTATLANDSVFAQINKIWERHRKQGLEDRHRTGVLLNEKFGKPTVRRQAYGEEQLKAYAARLGIAVSELSRMRGFARRFESVKDLNAQYPDVKTWTQVKELLVSLRKSETQKTEPPKDNTQKESGGSQPMRRTLQAIRTVRQCISQVQFAPDGSDRTSLLDAVNEMIADIEKSLGVRLTSVDPFQAMVYPSFDGAAQLAPMTVGA
jgi:hypothetical protein